MLWMFILELMLTEDFYTGYMLPPVFTIALCRIIATLKGYPVTLL